MIGYITVGTNDIQRAAAFYDKLFDAMGGSRLMETDRGIFWTFGPSCAAFGVMKPFDGQPASVGNGVMIALSVSSNREVDELHKTALGLGAPDEGAPGQRSDNFYSCYFRDPDGNKLGAFYMS